MTVESVELAAGGGGVIRIQKKKSYFLGSLKIFSSLLVALFQEFNNPNKKYLYPNMERFY